MEKNLVNVFLGPVNDYSAAAVARQAYFWNIPIITPGDATKQRYFITASLLDASSRLYMRVCPSVRMSVTIKEKRGLGASYVGYPALL